MLKEADKVSEMGDRLADPDWQYSYKLEHGCC